MTPILLLTGTLLAGVPAPSGVDGAALQPGDAPRIPAAASTVATPALTNSIASKIFELRQRSRLLLDERPGAGRSVGAGLVITLGIPTALAGIIGVLLPLDGGRGWIRFGAEWAVAGLGVLGAGVALISWGIWLAVTGSSQREAIDAELTRIDAKIESLEPKRRQPADAPSAALGFPVEAGMVLARF